MLAADDGNLFGNGGGVARRQDNPRVGVDEEPAQPTSKKCFGQERSSSKARLGIDLSLEFDVAARAAELPVERILNSRFGRQVVLVSFNQAHGHTRVQFFEHAHVGTVTGRATNGS